MSCETGQTGGKLNLKAYSDVKVRREDEVLVSEYASGPVDRSGRLEKSTCKAEYKEAADFFTAHRKFRLLSGRHPYKYAWIAKHKKLWPVTLACEVLGVSTSGYFEHWRRKDTDKPSRPGANKRIGDEALLVHIKSIHAEVKQEYGWPKMWKELVARGIRVGKERVRKLMQRHGIKARGKRKFVVTTDSKHNLPVAPNLLDRNFTPEAPNQVWTSDITYIATDEGWLYLTGVIDLFSRQVVGWSMRDNMQTNAVTDALRMAWFRRRPPPGLIFHSDRGSQYCSHDFQKMLEGYKMKSSMSRKGNCWDNAPTESLWGRLKVGRLYGRRFATRREAMDEVIDWLNFYNHKRLHSTLGYVSPMTFEQRWTAAQQQERKSA
jgi:transposase InsO family protein